MTRVFPRVRVRAIGKFFKKKKNWKYSGNLHLNRQYGVMFD